MHSNWKFMLAASLLAFLTSACGTPSVSGPDPVSADTVKISPAAQTALAQAETDIRLARSKFALWTTAESALRAAREAAAAGDSAGVLQHAAFASSQAKLGLQQLDLPTTERR